METKKTTEQRIEIRAHLGEIVEHAESIDKIVANIPHKRGLIYGSLNPKSKGREFITSSPNGFTSYYKHTDGKVYEINVHRRK